MFYGVSYMLSVVYAEGWVETNQSNICKDPYQHHQAAKRTSIGQIQMLDDGLVSTHCMLECHKSDLYTECRYAECHSEYDPPSSRQWLQVSGNKVIRSITWDSLASWGKLEKNLAMNWDDRRLAWPSPLTPDKITL
jgi:hypothetical protein